MKIVLVSGSYPPDVCGVGDYTRNVFEAGSGGAWALHTSSDWSLGSLTRHIRSINALRPEAVVVQYPTQGYGWSIVPHLLGVYYSLKPGVTFALALHESSQLSSKARAALFVLMSFAQRVIFTSRYEADISSRQHPRLRTRHTVIPINFNLRPSAQINPLSGRPRDVCYFGQIRPNKGLEQFLDVALKLVVDHPKIEVSIMGQVPAGYEDYLEQVRKAIHGTPNKILQDLPGEDVTAFLNLCKVAYLPFPDGMSERRGSFLAAISNGTAVVAHSGKFTSPALKAAFVEAGQSPISVILDVLSLNEQEYAGIQAKGFEYLKLNVPASWREVTRAYEDFLALPV
jgi:glycosyltransferase involved in cell wall biosynthesis